MTTNETPTSHVSDIPEDEPIIPPRQQPTVDTMEFRTVMVGTLPIETLDVEATALEQGPLYPKESRDKMTADKCNDLFKKAVKLSQACYDFTSMNMTNERCLADLYNMSIMITKTKASHQQYDMCDMFTVVFPLSEGSHTLEQKHLDLYILYDEVTEEEVAASCEWYNKWTAKEYYHDNLTLIFKHLENNMTHKLFEKCFEHYDTYPQIQQDRPLLFVIMMKTLVSSSKATQHLKDMVKNLKISDSKGENVLRMVSLIWGAYKHLKWIKRVPNHFVNQILQVLQTSSVPTFNKYFEHYTHPFLCWWTWPKWISVRRTLWTSTNSYRSWRRNTILWLVVVNGVESNPKGAIPPSPVKLTIALTLPPVIPKSPSVGIVVKLDTPFISVLRPRMTSELSLIATNTRNLQILNSPTPAPIPQVIHLLNGDH